MALRPGLCTAFTVKVWETLKNGGITTVVDFISRNPEELSQDFQLPYKDICSIRRVLLAEFSSLPINGSKLYETALSTLAILPTGFRTLDQLLDGGLYTGELTEIAGDSATGKTKICLHSIAATVTTAGQRAYFMDSVGSFDCQCLVEAVMGFTKERENMTEYEVKSILERVTCVQTLDIHELLSTLHSMQSLLAQQSPQIQNIKLIVIDNLATLINPLNGGDMVYRQGMLTHIGTQLKQLAVTHCIAVIVTNNMTASFRGSQAKAALGKAWSHMPHSRIILSRPDDRTQAENGMRKVELVKSGRQATPASCLISLDHLAAKSS